MIDDDIIMHLTFDYQPSYDFTHLSLIPVDLNKRRINIIVPLNGKVFTRSRIKALINSLKEIYDDGIILAP